MVRGDYARILHVVTIQPQREWRRQVPNQIGGRINDCARLLFHCFCDKPIMTGGTSAVPTVRNVYSFPVFISSLRIQVPEDESQQPELFAPPPESRSVPSKSRPQTLENRPIKTAF